MSLNNIPERVLDLPLKDIRIDGGTKSRADLDTEECDAAIDRYAKAIDDLPPAIVYHDGSSYWLAAGWLRYYAHKQAGTGAMRCRVRDGSLSDARLCAAGENPDHGLPRTEDDMHHVVKMLLTDPQHCNLSDGELIKACNLECSSWIIRQVRQQLAEKKERREYTTKHGTPATMNTANIGNPGQPRQRGVRIETDEEILAELDKQIIRSEKKAAVQMVRRGLTEDEAVERFRVVYRSISVIVDRQDSHFDEHQSEELEAATV